MTNPKLSKAVIPAAGLGTRMLPSTKEMPKEMLPIFFKTHDNIYMKPLLQIIFEQLYEAGFREFLFIVGRGKRIIEDHFTPDMGYVNFLRSKGKQDQASILVDFYNKVFNSTIMWVNQESPKGFGDAVLRAKPFVGNESFLVHAGDTLIVSVNNKHLKRLMEYYHKLEADAIFLAKKVENPKMYGIVIPKCEVKNGIFKVEGVIEKPEKPPSNLAIMPIYIFDPILFKALERVEPGPRGELELTDGIQKLIEWGLKVYTVVLSEDEIWLDIGMPETYYKALETSFNLSV